MASATLKKFLVDSNVKAFDRRHRDVLGSNISRYELSFRKGIVQFQDLNLARKRAAAIKHRAMNNLDTSLTDFEAQFIKNGGEVVWAQDKAEAQREIGRILQKHGVEMVVKSKSMITEELELNQCLEQQGIASVETDLGEFIVQISNDKPYHIVTPVMHKSKEDVAEIFHKQYGLPADSQPAAIAAFVRDKLKKKFTTAGAGITGVNFIVSDVGGIALTENEGNALMSVSFPKVHIAVAGIEKVIPSVHDLHLFWPLLAAHGTGQKVSVYNTLLTGPKRAGETNGPSHMYVVLVDNGRSRLLAKEKQRRALSCIRCGACLNVCPVYKNIGGHSYGTVYSGPIGAVIAPHMIDKKEFYHLSFATSLCGKCTDRCPVHIPLHKLLLENRKEFAGEGMTPSADKLFMSSLSKVLSKRSYMDLAGPFIKNLGAQLFLRKAWGSRRALPTFKPSFSKQWKQREV